MDECYIPEVAIEMIQQEISKIFSDYLDAMIKAFAPFADAFSNPLGVGELSYTEETSENSVKSTGTSPKKYGLSLLKQPRKTSMHYNYIPKEPRNLPYQRRAY